MNVTPELDPQTEARLEALLLTNPGSRLLQMEKCAYQYHKKHPSVWVQFQILTSELIERKFENYSASTIFGRIRWHFDIPDNEGQSSFKISNNHSPFYSRWFMKKNPDVPGFFRTRIQKSGTESSATGPELTPDYFDNPENN